VDYVFLPSVATMYPSFPTIRMDFGDMESLLEGELLPGNFIGLAMVVSKLFHLMRTHLAFFVLIDLQRAAIITRLVRDLSFSLKLEVVHTRREADGLAMSSRNLRLTDQERDEALILIRSLEKAKAELFSGKEWLAVRQEIRDDFSGSSSARL